MQARSQGCFLNAQMDMRRLQRLNEEFSQKVVDPKGEAKRLKVEASTADEVIEAFRMKQDEVELRVGLLIAEK